HIIDLFLMVSAAKIQKNQKTHRSQPIIFVTVSSFPPHVGHGGNLPHLRGSVEKNMRKGFRYESAFPPFSHSE
ncbi:MAG: hypothetical protein MSS15_05765, partial [Prevotella sp.]|nr:hypothetical protein [Prevotella sp.]